MPGRMLRTCPAHGAFDAPRCPTCQHEGTPLVTEARRTQLSRFLSGALRHFPDDVGLRLDEAGWVDADALLDAATSRYPWADADIVEAVLALDPKGRFETDVEAGRVRATYGHSIPVDLPDRPPASVPEVLYHGTAPGNLDAILDEGLRPMDRQAVHLSPDVPTAREVAQRRTDTPVILRVDAHALHADGIEVHRRAATVYTCRHLPPEAIEVHTRP